jgi:hypothetical protein
MVAAAAAGESAPSKYLIQIINFCKSSNNLGRPGFPGQTLESLALTEFRYLDNLQ